MDPKLPRKFYTRRDVVNIARELIGKKLCSSLGGQLTGGIIVETEAYSGRGDQACHSAGQRRTKRTEVMYQEGGVAYVYLCYGIHHLFNVVTNGAGQADAVLIRAICPTKGIEMMLARRRMSQLRPSLTAGPGVLGQSLGITTKLNGCDLRGKTIWIEHGPSSKGKGAGVGAARGVQGGPGEIEQGPRIGIAYAGKDAALPWRFFLKGNSYVSKARS